MQITNGSIKSPNKLTPIALKPTIRYPSEQVEIHSLESKEDHMPLAGGGGPTRQGP
jgi:hypothetical protein